MNYYEHHIGDYAQATAHLSFVEDAAYSRLIRKYYAEEKPLPADLKQVQRLVGARTKEEKSAVQTVLEEFFYLGDDGWHQERCDRVIAEYQDGEPEREVKKANEETRLKRHREERSRLFSLLNQAGQHAPWNLPMSELRALVQRHCNAPATEPATPVQPLPATAPATPATATQTPDTRHQTPVENQDQSQNPSAYAESEKPKNGFPRCPIDSIIKLYAEELPTNPQLKVRTPAREAAIRARWQQFFAEGDFTTEEGGIECFRWFFGKVKRSRFLTGQTDRPFRADLEWLMKAGNFAKIVEGRYDDAAR